MVLSYFLSTLTGLPPFKSVFVISAPAASSARNASTSPQTEIPNQYPIHTHTHKYECIRFLDAELTKSSVTEIQMKRKIGVETNLLPNGQPNGLRYRQHSHWLCLLTAN